MKKLISGKLRVAVIGVGNMGAAHVEYLPRIANVEVTALCDNDPKKLTAGLQILASSGLQAKGFDSHLDLLNARIADVVVIATPHYDHPPMGIRALETGHHVLVEKPIAVGVKGARELISAAKQHPSLVFGIMYNQRTNPIYVKLRELIESGELGEISRITWIATNWFRTNTYYASGGWRATWAGEGGGVLINQCPHNLDLLQWITGLMPSRVTAVGFIGKTHPIEVEDEMGAILEYPNGAIGHFITSTGEAPGTNRLEICGDRGRIVAEADQLTFFRSRCGTRELNTTSNNAFAGSEVWKIDVSFPRAPNFSEHERIMRNFVDACTNGAALIAPGEEGVRGLEIGNAMLMSAMEERSVRLPLDGAAYDLLLIDLAKRYGGRKTLEAKDVKVDMIASFH